MLGKRPARTLILCGLALAPAARGQHTADDIRVTYSLAWQDTGNGNGFLEPGESAIVRLSAHISPPINTFISSGAIIIVPGGGGTLRGLASSQLDIFGGNLRGGTLTAGPIDARWDLFGTPPAIEDERLRDVDFGQFPVTNNLIMTTNPVADVFRFAWTPSDYTPRSVSLMTAAGTHSEGHASAVYLITGSTTRVVINVQPVFQGVQLVVVPSPGAAAAIAMAALVASQRRARDRRRPEGSLATCRWRGDPLSSWRPR